MRRLDPGELVAAGLVATALVADVVLIRCDHLPVSTCLRRNALARAAVLLLAAHLLFVLPFDPLSWLGGKCMPRRLG